MACEKPAEQLETMDSSLILTKPEGKSKVAFENKISSDSISSNQSAASSSEGSQESVVGADVYNPTSSSSNYYYPGYDESNRGKDHSSMGVQTNQNVKSKPNSATTIRSNGIKPSELYSNINKLSSMNLNSKSRSSFAPPNMTKPKVDTQPKRPLNKSGSYYPPVRYTTVYQSPGSNHSSSSQKRGVFGNAGPTPMDYISNSRTWNGNNTIRLVRKNEFEISSEITRGPRVNKKTISNSSEKLSVGPTIEKSNKYNLAEFQTEYESAKFYVIKSFSEDDVHKCLMYGVWSSTAHGNKKLDTAFYDVEFKANETGVKCPIFLFFSVNGSGQFVGVAEMIGKVDFNKNMDFWQLDEKWTGFFPVKWHIVKDIPNSQLKHIILENNDNRPVTFTRDTQEICLKQGVEMLKIFKNYESSTSLLDDMEFYEGREKALHMKNINKPVPKQTIFMNGNLPLENEDGDEDNEEEQF